MAKNICFFGPVGKKNSIVVGGGESGNLKTINILENAGFNVTVVRKPYPLKIFKVFSAIIYLIQFIYSIFLITYILVMLPKDKIFHLSGFYSLLIYFEYVLVTLSKYLGVRRIYEIRAGGFDTFYDNGSWLYRYFVKKTIQNSSIVLCQGERYIKLVNSFGIDKAVYYPNYVKGNLVHEYSSNNRDKDNKISMIFVGRITKSKNIDFIIDVCSKLKEQYEFTLNFIGNYDTEYYAHINHKIKEEKLTNNIVFCGVKHHDEIMCLLKQSHFFLFPTKEPREGHSNALTEAMSQGVIPIASNWGFNKSIISNDKLVINEFDSSLYASLISTIWCNNEWLKYSNAVFSKVRENYTEEHVAKTLINIY